MHEEAIEYTDEQDQQSQFLTFLIGKDIYGLPILKVKEIIEYNELTTVPLVPDYIKGVLNLRGSVIPVIDLSSRLDLGVSPISKRSCIVIVDVESEDGMVDLGMLVDEVAEVKEIEPDDIEPAPDFGAKIRTDFIIGMGRKAEGFIVLLDVQNVLSIEELTVLEGIRKPA